MRGGAGCDEYCYELAGCARGLGLKSNPVPTKVGTQGKLAAQSPEQEGQLGFGLACTSIGPKPHHQPELSEAVTACPASRLPLATEILRTVHIYMPHCHNISDIAAAAPDDYCA